MGSNSDPLTAKPSGRVGTGPRLHERQRVRVVGRPTPRAVAVLQQHMAFVERHMGPLDKQFESRLENLPPPPVPQALLELPCSYFQGPGDFVEVLPGRCWVVPAVLTSQE